MSVVSRSLLVAAEAVHRDGLVAHHAPVSTPSACAHMRGDALTAYDLSVLRPETHASDYRVLLLSSCSCFLCESRLLLPLTHSFVRPLHRTCCRIP